MSNVQKKIKPVFAWACAEIYKQNLWISIGQSDKQFYNSLMKNVMNLSKEEAQEVVLEMKQRTSRHHGLFMGSQGLHLIRLYIPADMNNPSFHGVLAHEVLHATCHLLRERGMELCEESEEAYTYLNDFFITKIYSALVKK
jgi:hypothetical protein